MKKYQPINENIIVKRLKHEEKKVGNILVVDKQKSPLSEGIVIGVGDVCTPTIQEDDIVVFPSYLGTALNYGDPENDYLILSSEEVLATKLKENTHE